MENDFSESGKQADTPSEVRTAADDWLSLCVWLAWLIYAWSGSIGYALFGFFVLQAAVAWYLRMVIKTSRRTLSLPRTRQHLQELLEDLKRGTSGF